jgi:hypothetical protein
MESNPQTNLISEPRPAGNRKRSFLFYGSMVYSFVLVNFVVWGGFSLGFFLTLLLGQIGLFIFLPKPSSAKELLTGGMLALCILGLGSSFLLYTDPWLGIINFLVILALFLIQLFVYSQSLSFDWDQPGFYVELLIAPFVRPFVSLGKLGQEGRNARIGKQKSVKTPAGGNSGATSAASSEINSDSGMGPILKVFIGLLIAAPLLLVIIALLSSADAVFGIYVKKVWDTILRVNVVEYAFSGVIAVFLFPFLFSFLHSYQRRWNTRWIRESFSTQQQYKRYGDPLIAGTVLLLLNMVYGFFTWIQFQYLFDAFQNILPTELTYAEYARQGFFQLATVACINILIIMVSVFLIRRGSGGGVLVRLMSVLLILFTWVLMVSAGYRMKMYIDAYALTKLRVLVSLFMVLIGLILLYALLKEFFSKFRFFKFSLITAVLILMMTNFLNINARIAQYNIDQYQKKILIESKAEIDWRYLIVNLSDDAIPVILRLTDAEDKKLARDVTAAIQLRYKFGLKDYRENNWKRFNIGREQAKVAVEKELGLKDTSHDLKAVR